MIDLSKYNFSALIFDCDGTLVHSAPLHFIAMGQALREQGHDISRKWYFDRVGFSREDLFQDYQQLYSVSIDVPAACKKSQDVYREIASQVKPVKEVVAVARDYFGKLPMAVASGGEGEFVQASLKAAEVDGLFPHVVTLSDVNIGKPAPDIFLEAARRLHVPTSECLVFEDSKEGLEAASNAGMQAIDVRPFIAP